MPFVMRRKVLTVAKSRQRISRSALSKSAARWKFAPAGFNVKHGLAPDAQFFIPRHVKRPTKRTLTLSASDVEKLRTARGKNRSRVIARVQRNIESAGQRKEPIAERLQRVANLPKVTRLVPVIRPDGDFDKLRMTGEALAHARDRAEAIRRANRNPKALESYNSRYANPAVIGGSPFIIDRAELTNAKRLMTRSQRKTLDKLYAEMFVD
jgi:hypothetical protein